MSNLYLTIETVYDGAYGKRVSRKNTLITNARSANLSLKLLQNYRSSKNKEKSPEKLEFVNGRNAGRIMFLMSSIKSIKVVFLDEDEKIDATDKYLWFLNNTLVPEVPEVDNVHQTKGLLAEWASFVSGSVNNSVPWIKDIGVPTGDGHAKISDEKVPMHFTIHFPGVLDADGNEMTLTNIPRFYSQEPICERRSTPADNIPQNQTNNLNQGVQFLIEDFVTDTTTSSNETNVASTEAPDQKDDKVELSKKDPDIWKLEISFRFYSAVSNKWYLIRSDFTGPEVLKALEDLKEKHLIKLDTPSFVSVHGDVASEISSDRIEYIKLYFSGRELISFNYLETFSPSKRDFKTMIQAVKSYSSED